MIVHDKRPSWFKLVLSYHGTAFSHIRGRVGLALLISLGVTYAWHYFPAFHDASLTSLPFTLTGLALSIFLGFRNNTSYDRFWEGRKLWGRLVNTSRSLTRQILTLIDTNDEAHRALVYRVAAYVHSLRLHLRNEQDFAQLEPFIPTEQAGDLREQLNPPVALLQGLGTRFRKLWKDGALETFHLPVLEQSLADLTDIQGGCERIKSTPIPFAYTVLIHRIVGAYCFLLPFGIVTTVGYLTPVVVFFVAYAFFGLDDIGDEIEEPFGYEVNDLPLSQLSRMIEVNLRQALGEQELPELVQPVDSVLQ